MIFCPNCAKRTGYKRALGVGTFFAVALTAGFWLLALPFYPKRCITCGLRKSDSVPWYETWRVVALPIFAIVVVLVLIDKLQQPSEPAQVVRGPDYNDSRTPNSVSSSETLAPDAVGQVIEVDATGLLAAYQADEGAANARYGKNKVAVTGVLTGVFIPSLAVSLRMAEKGLGARTFVTMGGPRPSSAEETLFLPGIKASSDEHSLFGQPDVNGVSGTLRIGATATLLCTVGEAFRVSDLTGGPHKDNADYSLGLDDCTLQNNVHETWSSLTKSSGVNSGERAGPDVADGTTLPRANFDTPLKAIFEPDAEYTDEARKAKLQGSCTLEFAVGEDGLARDIHVTRALGDGLDEKAVEALQRWRFEPATKDGKPVPTRTSVEMTFRLKLSRVHRYLLGIGKILGNDQRR
jgi:TonB family protein